MYPPALVEVTHLTPQGGNKELISVSMTKAYPVYERSPRGFVKALSSGSKQEGSAFAGSFLPEL